jgi:prepilin-type N-terminal cleavage/methylation domain-containing protein
LEVRNKLKIENGKLKIRRGFTLIELLLVIAIIGILAVVLISMINPRTQIRKGRAAKAKQTLTKIANAGETYMAEKGYYKTASSSCWDSWVAEGYAKGSLPSDSDVTYTMSVCTTTRFCVAGTVTGETAPAWTWHYDSDAGKTESGSC